MKGDYKMIPKKRPISYVDKKVNELNDKIDLLEKQIPDIDQETEITSKLNDRCDELEAKNYQLKSDIDRIIKAIEYYKIELLKPLKEVIR